jgi:hypothetical protein
MNHYRYILLDEGGNFDFSPKGTRLFTLTSVTKVRPFQIAPVLDHLKYDLIETGLDLEYFHASEDRQPVRDQVFTAIRARFGGTVGPSNISGATAIEAGEAGPPPKTTPPGGGTPTPTPSARGGL